MLAVTRGNDTARRLYSAAAFVAHAVDPHYLKVDGRYYDLEWMWLRL